MESFPAFFRRVLIVAAVVLAAIVVWRIYTVLLLAFAAALLAALLRAIADFIARYTHLHPKLAYAGAILLVSALLVTAGYVFGAQVKAQANVLAEIVPRAIDSVQQWLNSQAWLQAVLRNVGGGAGGIASRLSNVILVGFDVGVDILVVVFGAIYFGAQPNLYRNGIVMLFPPRQHARVGDALDVCAYAMRRWLLGQLVDMAVVGVLTGVGLWLIGVPSALALGLFSGLASFVPYVGPIASGALAVLVASGEGLSLALWTLGLYLLVQQIEGHLIIPFVQRWTIALPPAMGVFAVVGMGYLFGPLGLLFATPLAVVAFVLVKKLYLQDVLNEDAPVRPSGASR